MLMNEGSRNDDCLLMNEGSTNEDVSVDVISSTISLFLFSLASKIILTVVIGGGYSTRSLYGVMISAYVSGLIESALYALLLRE